MADYKISSEINVTSEVTLGSQPASHEFRYTVLAHGNEKGWVIQERRVTKGEAPGTFQRFIGLASHFHVAGTKRVEFKLEFPIPFARTEDEAWDFFGGCLQQRGAEAVAKWEMDQLQRPQKDAAPRPPPGRAPGGLILPPGVKPR